MFKKIIAFLLIFALAAVLCSCESIFPSGQSGETDENAPAETAPAEEEKGLGEDAWMASVSTNTIVQSEGITTAFIKEWFEDHTVYAAYPIVENLDAVSEELKQFAVESIEGYESTLVFGGRDERAFLLFVVGILLHLVERELAEYEVVLALRGGELQA